MGNIAILITTVKRDKLLEKVVNSIRKIRQTNWQILIADQCYTEEKRLLYPDCGYYHVPYDCGISYSRNFLVKEADYLGYDHCLLSADSIEFTESMKYLNILSGKLKWNPENDYDLFGLGLENRIGWEGWLKLIPNECFEINFIEKEKDCTQDFNMWDCSIVRNFFLATTDSLLKIKWDNKLKASEHEDFFIRYLESGYKVGCTDICKGKYIGTKEGEYSRLRRKNISEGRQILLEKWGIKKWVQYKNLENTKKYKD